MDLRLLKFLTSTIKQHHLRSFDSARCFEGPILVEPAFYIGLNEQLLSFFRQSLQLLHLAAESTVLTHDAIASHPNPCRTTCGRGWHKSKMVET